jgi:hypothetical protein
MPKTFRESFEQTLDALQVHPKIEVFDAILRPPASPADIAAAEEALKRPLPDDVREFYLAHDGVFLAWGLRGRTYPEPLEAFAWPDYGTPPGVINLLPIRQVFSPEWVADGTINWTADDHRVIYGVDQDDDDENEDDDRLRAVVVDFFSKFHHADLVFGPADRPAWTLIADDHGAELMESNLSSFATYLDVVLAQWGTNRMRVYKVARYRQPQEITAPKSRPTLDEVVAKVEADRD